MRKISGLILAAGESRRMGTLKQLLPFGEKTVIETVLDNFIESGLYEVIVVLGHQAEKISEVIAPRPVKIVVNENYKDGMLSSIQRGVGAICDCSEAFIIGLGDQPFVSSSIIKKIIAHFAVCNSGIVLPCNNGRRGHPVIIHKKYIDEISQLDPNIGMRQLIQRHADDISSLDFPSDDVIRDMDVPEDYTREIKFKNVSC